MHEGSCLCGAVRFQVDGELQPPDACHCRMCRKVSGHFWASTDVAESALRLQGARHVTWYASSGKVERGFCSICGCALFWKPVGKHVVAVAMGAFDGATRTHLEKHIFVADKGDYYVIGDDLPQHPR